MRKMNEQLLKRIFSKMADEFSFNHVSVSEMQEQMRDPENILEFLLLFGKAINISTSGCASAKITCDGCKRYTGHHSDCIKDAIFAITHYYSQKSTEWRITTSKMILPGKFSKEQAEQIIKAYNSDEYKMEEVK